MIKSGLSIDPVFCDIKDTKSLAKYIYQLIIQVDALNQHSIVTQTDIHGNINYVNDLFCTISGFSREELLGRNHRIIKSQTHPNTLYQELWKTIKTGGIWSGEICNTTKSGCHYWVKTIIMPLPNHEGYISIRTDITKQKMVENELAITVQNLSKSNKIKNQFLTNINHEIRTPLNAILGLTEVLKRSNLEEISLDIVNKIYSAGHVLLRNFNDIINFSEIENGGIEIENKKFSLHQVVSEVYRIENLMAKEKGLFLVLDQVPEDLFLFGDSTRLSQILLNLVSNAIKFTPNGEIKISTKKIAKQQRCWIRFEVCDTGIGIPSDKLNKLFKPFSQVDDSITRRFGGTGLGLSICKSLVDIMQGEIGVESSEGQGSTFWFELPFAVASADEIEKNDALTTVPHTPSNQIPLCLQDRFILVVDDSPVNRYMMQYMLEPEGAYVTLAEDGIQAIHLLTLYPKVFDIILMDIQMPVKDGFQTVECIRQELLLDIPVIMCSANTDPERKSEALKVGADGFIEKPVDLELLISVLKSAIDTRGLGDLNLIPSSISKVWPDIEGILGNEVKQQIGDDLDLYIEMLVIFNKELQRALDQLPKKIKNQDWVGASQFLHKLRGAAGVIFALDLVELCTEFENTLHHNISNTKANFCLDVFLAHTQGLSKQIQTALTSLPHGN